MHLLVSGAMHMAETFPVSAATLIDIVLAAMVNRLCNAKGS
jgi:hypothetical protein